MYICFTLPEALPRAEWYNYSMSQRKYNFVPGEFYHIYNRGTDKRPIFLDESDYQRFQTLLYLANTNKAISLKDIYRNNSNPFDIEIENKLVAIGAYCLMPNHFHILITPLSEVGLSVFMQKISTAYSMYFNKKYERTGSLFQGKFKSQHASEDPYLKYLFSYIHLNPIKLIQSDWKEIGIKDKQKAQDYLNSYKYSSYPEYCNQNRLESKIIDRTNFPDYFEGLQSSEREVLEWLFARGKASGIDVAETRLAQDGKKLTHSEVWE